VRIRCQRGTDVFSPELALRGSQCLGIRRHEHRFDPPRRADSQHAAIAVAAVPESVDRPTGDIDESSGRGIDQSVTHPERVLPLQHVKSFVEDVLVEQRTTRIAGRSEALVMVNEPAVSSTPTFILP
jgi:hypothetical protein